MDERGPRAADGTDDGSGVQPFVPLEGVCFPVDFFLPEIFFFLVVGFGFSEAMYAQLPHQPFF